MDLSVELTKLLTTARREAVLLGHSMVGSEHLLLALMQRRGTEAAWLLEQSGWDPEALRQILRARGSGTLMQPFEGIANNVERRYRETQSDYSRKELEECMSESPCPTCGGKRLKKEGPDKGSAIK